MGAAFVPPEEVAEKIGTPNRERSGEIGERLLIQTGKDRAPKVSSLPESIGNKLLSKGAFNI